LTPVLLDSSVFVSLIDRRQRWHAACVNAVELLDRKMATCEAVIVESCHLLRQTHLGKETVIENVSAGTVEIPFQLSQALPQIQRILRKYAGRQIDLADACLIHLAEQLDTPDILTLDRDFDVYRWSRNRPFRRLIQTVPV
jgi:predicted nucleic acid-binding protein